MQTQTILKQRGMSLGGLIIFLVFIIFAAYVVARTLPAYMDYWQIGHVLENSLQTLGGEKLTTKEIRYRFEKELSLNNIDTVGPQDLSIEATKEGYLLSVEYSVKKPLWREISLCMDFKAERQSK